MNYIKSAQVGLGPEGGPPGGSYSGPFSFHCRIRQISNGYLVTVSADGCRETENFFSPKRAKEIGPFIGECVDDLLAAHLAKEGKPA